MEFFQRKARTRSQRGSLQSGPRSPKPRTETETNRESFEKSVRGEKMKFVFEFCFIEKDLLKLYRGIQINVLNLHLLSGNFYLQENDNNQSKVQNAFK